MTAAKKTVFQQEIEEQPEALGRLLKEGRGLVADVAGIIRERNPRYVVFSARGSSDNAARYGQYLFGTKNGLTVALATPSLFTLYDSPPALEEALVLGISQSGQSPDMVTVVEDARRQGALTVAITNTADSPLADAAEHTIPLLAGKEQCPAASKSYTTSLMALAMLSAAVAEDEARLAELEAMPDTVSGVVSSTVGAVEAAVRYRYMEYCEVISRGYNYSTAFEIALKLKELTYTLAEPHSSADFLHGPMAMVDSGFPVIVAIPDGRVSDDLVDVAGQLKERGAELVVISSRRDALDMAHTPLPMPDGVPEWLSPLVMVVPGQFFALGLTLAKGLDPDHLRGLDKITLTR
jgi:glucosamine--fructose-6-phosphate aminotransferase (isomerizing)